ncbi:MAG: phage portal protein [Hyphomonadaceae bacterium]|nr:phage portal protein [Hyphomonadaceae bacterium]
MNDSPIGWALSNLSTRLRSFAGGGSRAPSSGGTLVARRVPTEQRASQVGRILFVATGGQIRQAEVRYEDMAREGYRQNPVVYRCTRFIADALKSMPLVVFDGDKEADESHPLKMVLDSPNPMQIWEELVDAIVGHLVFAGEFFLEGITLSARGGQLQEIYALRPDKMNPKPGPDGLPIAYVYKAEGGDVTYDAQVKMTGPGMLAKFIPILHVKNWHPTDHWRGMAIMEPAAGAADEHTDAVAYNKALLRNSARPSGALVYQPKEGPASLSDDAYERLNAELQDEYSGAQNAGKPLLLDGGLEWKPMGLSPKDLESGEGRAAAAREIALALGVPPLMLGIKGDNTFANFEEANLAFWKFTVFPLARLLQRKLTAWVRPLYPNCRIVLDPDGSPVAEAIMKARWDRVAKADWLTVNEKREATGFDAIEDEAMGSAIIMPAATIPLADLIDRAELTAASALKASGYGGRPTVN